MGVMVLSNLFEDCNIVNYYVGEVRSFLIMLGKFFKGRIILVVRCSWLII